MFLLYNLVVIRVAAGAAGDFFFVEVEVGEVAELADMELSF